jgi:hypothetical protein
MLPTRHQPMVMFRLDNGGVLNGRGVAVGVVMVAENHLAGPAHSDFPCGSGVPVNRYGQFGY